MSTPQFSLLIYEDGSDKNLLEQDLKSFFHKFSIPYEVIWISPYQQNFRHFLQLCEKAQADYIVTLNASLTSPLGDVLKLLQTLIANDNLHIVFGERWSKLKVKKDSFLRWEYIFTQSLIEKKRPILKDPFCPFVALRRKNWLTTDLQSKSYFITAELQKRTLGQTRAYAEVPLLHSPRSANARPSFLGLLWFSLRF